MAVTGRQRNSLPVPVTHSRDGTDGIMKTGYTKSVWVHMEELTVGLPKGSRTACSIGWSAGRPDGAGSPIVGREAAPRGVRSPAGTVLRPQASAVSKPASNWGGAERGRGMRGADFERMRRRRGQCHSHGSYGRRGLVEMVCAPRNMEEERLTVPFRFVKQEPSRRWYSDASYQAIGGFC